MAVGAQLVNDSNKDVPIIIRDGSFRLICFERDLFFWPGKLTTLVFEQSRPQGTSPLFEDRPAKGP
jgi:hypothetical protein